MTLPGEPHQLLKLFQMLVGDVSLADAAPLASTVGIGLWLPRLLADIYAWLLNFSRPEHAPLIPRDMILDSVGLGYEARQDRLAIERSQPTETTFRF